MSESAQLLSSGSEQSAGDTCDCDCMYNHTQRCVCVHAHVSACVCVCVYVCGVWDYSWHWF